MADVEFDCGKLNLIPGVMIPTVVHCSYGDEGQIVKFTLYKGKDEYKITGSGVTAKILGVRADGANWGPIDAAINGSEISFELNNTMTGFQGGGLAEIAFTKQSGSKYTKIGTANFAIMVEPASWWPSVVYEEDISVYRSILRYVDQNMKLSEQTLKQAKSILSRALQEAKSEVEKNAPTYVQDWLNDHTATGEWIIDSTLSISNAAADAKTTGDKITTLEQKDVDLTKKINKAAATVSYVSRQTDILSDCCDSVGTKIRRLNNIVSNIMQMHPAIYLLTTNGEPLLTTNGEETMVTL